MGANIHAQNDAGFCWACHFGRLAVVQYLVSLGINIDIRNKMINDCKKSHIVAYLKTL
jgi:ankyrin repeat protein